MIYTCSKCGYPNELSKRSSQQNKYLHVALTLLANELGYDLDEMKAIMKYHFKYYKELTDKNTGETLIVYDETSKMNSKQCSEFTEKIIRFAAEHGISIESPEEYFAKIYGNIYQW